MKNFKRIMALVLAITIVCAMSLTTFAFDLKAGTYSFEIKFLDADNNVITSAAPGAKIKMAFYVYTTDGKAAISVAANKNAEMSYGVIVPNGFCVDTPSEDDPFNASKGDAMLMDADDFLVLTNAVDTTAGLESDATAPFATHEFTLSDTEADFDSFAWYEDFVVLSDGATGVSAPTLVDIPAFSIKAAAAPVVDVTPGEAKTTATLEDGTVLENVYANDYSVVLTKPVSKFYLVLKKVGGTKENTFSCAKNLEGGATLNASVLLVGVPDGVTLECVKAYAE